MHILRNKRFTPETFRRLLYTQRIVMMARSFDFEFTIYGNRSGSGSGSGSGS